MSLSGQLPGQREPSHANAARKFKPPFDSCFAFRDASGCGMLLECQV